jgi:putative sterol carrier protein
MLPMSVSEDLKEIFSKMPEAFVSEKATGINAAIQLDLQGDDGGQWVLEIANGQIAVEAGTTPTPNLTLTMDAADYVAISKGDANPMTLFMTGKIKVEGDITLAMKFQDFFDRNRVS